MTQHEYDVIIRPSFKKICGNDACRAALFNHILCQIAKEGNAIWRAATGNLVLDLSGAWGKGKVRQEVNCLIWMGLLGSLPGVDLAKYLTFGAREGEKLKEACNHHRICMRHHIDLPSDVSHLLEQANAINECCCQEVQA